MRIQPKRSCRALISEIEFEAIWQSADKARDKVLHDFIDKEFKPMLEPVDDVGLHKVVPYATPWELRKRLRHMQQGQQIETLWNLFEGPRDLSAPEVSSVIRQAAETNDVQFFVWLGRVLSRAPRKLEGELRLKLLLTRKWACMRFTVWRNKIGTNRYFTVETAPLCLYTNPALTRYCQETLDDWDLTEDQVDKARQRLKLRPAKKKFVLGYQLDENKRPVFTTTSTHI